MIPHRLRNPKLLRLVVIVAAAAGVFAAAPWTDGAQANDSDSAIGLIAVDVNTAGNTATSLGLTDTCVRIEPGATVVVDIVVDAIPTDRPMTAFQLELLYDPAIVNVTANDVAMLLATNADFNPQYVGNPLPDTDGDFLVAVADFTMSPGDTGPGVLSRITLSAVGSGVTNLSPAGIDIRDDHNKVIPVQALAAADVAVGQKCPAEAPTTTTTPPAGQPTPGTPPDGTTDDGDGDGVTDVVDKCPGTASGAPVDTNGCSDSRVDEDGDGVCNPDAPSGGPSGCTGSDQCPDTPAGDSVDASGCSATQLQKLKEEAKERLIETATPHLNLDASLETVTVGGSTDVLAVFADENSEPTPGVDITFKIDQQPGSSADLDDEASVTKTSDTDGVAEAKLNVGDTPGEIVVSATAEGETETITITVEAGRTGADTSPTDSTPTTTATPSGQGGATETPAAGGDGIDSGDDSDGGGIGAWIVGPIAAVGLALLAAGYIAFRRIRKRAT